MMPRIRHVSPPRALERDCTTDRKSTRLNSSHSQISYAVFCLKKKQHAAVHPPARGELDSSSEQGSLLPVRSRAGSSTAARRIRDSLQYRVLRGGVAAADLRGV